jgi:hypothetical protein
MEFLLLKKSEVHHTKETHQGLLSANQFDLYLGGI